MAPMATIRTLQTAHKVDRPD